MARRLNFVISAVLTGYALASPSIAADGKVDWLTRCSRELADARNPESGSYGFATRGKDEGAQGRADMDYTAQGGPNATVYLTDYRDFMSKFTGASLGVTWYGDVDAQPPHGMKMAIGRVSMIASSRDFKPIPGKVTMKLVLDGKTFGPYEPKASSASGGMYNVWLDTADTDGDSSPPVLSPKKFAALAKAVGVMKAAEIIIVQDGKDVARMPVPLGRHIGWRDGLPTWAAQTRARIKGYTSCIYPDNVVN
jgi:hypothetical protein